MELLKPVQGVGHQEVAHLGASEVEDEGAPVWMLAAQRVGVLVQRGAVESRQSPLVLREVGGDPVDDDSDSGLVELVDEVAQVVGGAVPRRRRVIAGHLIAPGGGEGVLRQGHELDVGEAAVLDVADELLGDLPVGQPGPPASQMHLVDGERAGVGVLRGALGHPFVVCPFVAGIRDEGSGRRRHLRALGHRVGLLMPREVVVLDLVLVPLALERSGDEDLPHSRRAERAHGVQAAVPTVEVADDPNGLGVGRPHREAHAADVAELAGEGLHVRAECFPQPLVAALREQVEVELSDGRKEPVGIVAPVFDVAVDRDDPVIGDFGRLQDGPPDSVELVLGLGAALGGFYEYAISEAAEDADGCPAVFDVGAQHFVGGVVPAVRDRIQEVLVDVNVVCFLHGFTLH